MAKYIFVYKTTNKITNKIYIGVHSTNNLNDTYIGGGIRRESDVKRIDKSKCNYFLNSILKYGFKNFEREILFMCKTLKEAYRVESEIVTEAVVKDNRYMNTKLGGIGGWGHINNNKSHRDKNLIRLKDRHSDEKFIKKRNIIFRENCLSKKALNKASKRMSELNRDVDTKIKWANKRSKNEFISPLKEVYASKMDLLSRFYKDMNNDCDILNCHGRLKAKYKRLGWIENKKAKKLVRFNEPN